MTKFFWENVNKKGIVSIQKIFSNYTYIVVSMHMKLSVEKDIPLLQVEQLCKLVRNFPDQNLKRFSGNFKVFIGCQMMCTKTVYRIMNLQSIFVGMQNIYDQRTAISKK